MEHYRVQLWIARRVYGMITMNRLEQIMYYRNDGRNPVSGRILRERDGIVLEPFLRGEAQRFRVLVRVPRYSGPHQGRALFEDSSLVYTPLHTVCILRVVAMSYQGM
jgi:hypothetical protein